MKKRLAAMVISIISVLALSGCYPTGKKVNENLSSVDSENAPFDGSHSENSSSTASGSTHLDGTHFEYSKDNLDVSFDLPEVPDKLPSRIKLKEKTFDHQEVIDLFFGGEAPVSEYLYGVNNESGEYTASDGSELIITDNMIDYINGDVLNQESLEGLKSPVSYSRIMRFCREYMRDRYSITEDEIDGFPLQEALDSANELISKLGIAGLGEPKIYAFSLECYEKMKPTETRIFNEEYPLTKDNEIYVFKFPRLFGEVELSDLHVVEINDSTSEIPVSVISPSLIVGVSRNGIFKFSIDAVYETDGEVLSEEPVKYDLGHAVSELEKYFDRVYFTASKKGAINKAKVVYYPVERNEPGTVEFTPAWSFEGCATDAVMAAEIGHVSFWDLSYIVNADVGVVLEYSEA